MIVQDVPVEVRIDPTALYEAAVADRLAGRNEEAIEKLDRVLQARPGDVDARLNRGLALLAMNRSVEAESDFRTVLDVSPDYVDARIGLARAAQRRGDRKQAWSEAGRALAAAPDRPDVQVLRQALGLPTDWRVDFDVSRSRLGAGLPDWSDARFAAVRRIHDRWNFGVAAEWTERFGQDDVFLEGRLDHRIGAGGVYVAMGAAVKADYRPQASLRAGADVPLAGGISATLDVSAARFASGTVQSLQPGLAAELVRGRLRLAARWINVWDEMDQRRDGYAASIQWAATDRIRLRLDTADAPETSEGVTVDVGAVSLGAEVNLTDQTSLRFGVLKEDRGAYDREAISLGLGWRFW